MTHPPPKIEMALPLPSRNRFNCTAEEFNDLSKEATIECRDGGAAAGLQVGKAIRAYYGYSEVEITRMASSSTYRKSVGPLPNFVQALVIDAEAALQEARTAAAPAAAPAKEKEAKQPRPLLHSVAVELKPRVLGQRIAPTIPQIFLETMKSGVDLPWSWFTDDRVKFANEQHAILDIKSVTPRSTDADPTPAKVQILDCTKMTAKWGDDVHPRGINWTAMLFFECAGNVSTAFNLLSEVLSEEDADKGTMETQCLAHTSFFRNIPGIESKWSDLQELERQLRYDAIISHIRVDPAYYAQRVENLITMKSLLASQKRSADSFIDHRIPKAPRYPSQSQSFRESEISSSSSGFQAPSCISCGGGHLVNEHPASQTTFSDGIKLYTAFISGKLVVARTANLPTPQLVCISYNVRGCRGGKHDVKDKLHVCSLCGGSHGALSRDSRCPRVRDGKIMV
jgi:hypothetical protein